MDETKIELLGHNYKGYVWRIKMRLSNLRGPYQPSSIVVVASSFGDVLPPVIRVNCPK